MKMIITHSAYQSTLEDVVVEDPKFIPRIGEQIAIWHTPYPKVTQIIHELNEDRIIVIAN